MSIERRRLARSAAAEEPPLDHSGVPTGPLAGVRAIHQHDVVDRG